MTGSFKKKFISSMILLAGLGANLLCNNAIGTATNKIIEKLKSGEES